MPKAKSRIRTGTPKKRSENDLSDKSHLKTIEAGENVPAEQAKGVPASAIEGKAFKSVIDPDDPSSLDGMEAARQSLMMRPDNPNRPASIPGEDWKVSLGGGASPAASGVHEERTQIGSTTPTPAQEAANEAGEEQIEADEERLQAEREARGE